jgi:hypothetical protein
MLCVKVPAPHPSPPPLPSTALQYLADLHAVHAALEASLATAAAAELAAGSGSQLPAALQLFSREQGFDRSSALLLDLQHVLAAGQQEQDAASSSSSSSGAAAGSGAAALPPPTQHAAAYAAYIASLARLCTAAEGPAELTEVRRPVPLCACASVPVACLCLRLGAMALGHPSPALPRQPTCGNERLSLPPISAAAPCRRCCACWPTLTSCTSCT